MCSMSMMHIFITDALLCTQRFHVEADVERLNNVWYIKEYISASNFKG